MTATIAYDRPVKNLIDALSRTGHVTHTAYKKTSVTLHHNAGRLSHEGCLEVWKVRPASAHFQTDSAGTLCQYVKVNEYAWAAGDGTGNRTSIHIEMANSSTGGQWPVAQVTWLAAARLAGWLHARVIGFRPSKSSLFYHHHWRNTACAGPYMDTVYSRVLAAAQAAYDAFAANKTPTTPEDDMPLTDADVARIFAAKVVPAAMLGGATADTRIDVPAALDLVMRWSLEARNEATVGRQVAQAHALKGAALTPEEIAAIGAAVGANLSAGFDVNLTPKAAS